MAGDPASREKQENLRDEKGRFVPGASGNKSGRPRQVGYVRQLAQQHTEQAVATLAEICGDESAPARARIAAAEALLDRAYGKPAQAITGPDGESSPQLQIHISTDQSTAQQIDAARRDRELREQEQGELIDVTPGEGGRAEGGRADGGDG